MLDPQARALLDLMIDRGVPPTHTLSPADARRFYLERRTFSQPKPPVVGRVQALEAEGPHGAIPMRLYEPPMASDGPLPVLVYFHGGGWTIGDLDTHDVLCRQLCAASGVAVVSVDYRLGPEHRFPAAVDDCIAATRWVQHEAAALGLDASRLAVGGDSAGGTLAAVCAIEARNAGLPLALQMLFYPGTTGHQDTPSHRHFAHGFVLEEPHISYFFNHYVRSPADRDDWRFAPLYADDVDGVAPAWIGLAECDPLVDEGVMYADKLRLAGVPVDLEIYRGVVHEFIKMGRAIPEARQAHADAARALQAAFTPE